MFNFRIHCFHATNQITSRFGFLQGLRQRSVSREALGPRMAGCVSREALGPRMAGSTSFSYPEPFLRAVNGARQGALAKSISNWHLIGYNEGYCSNNVYILLPCFYGIRFWIWPEPLVAPRVRRALGTRMALLIKEPATQANVYVAFGNIP